MSTASAIRPCRPDEKTRILAIINDAAEAYRGVIPEDCWHDPYMSMIQLEQALASGVVFSGAERDGELVGVMGIQTVRDVDLIRHAYVLTNSQQHGIGKALLVHLLGMTQRPLLVGTWADAVWAVRFYERQGFRMVSPQRKDLLLRAYWEVGERQIETSVVLERIASAATGTAAER